jgi:hypothetical protein
LQDGPVLLGAPWYNAWFEPAPGGWLERPGWQRSGIAGGHEVELIGVDVDTRDLSRSVLYGANSWGSGWSDHGYFKLRLSTYEQLKECDLKQFVVAAQ